MLATGIKDHYSEAVTKLERNRWLASSIICRCWKRERSDFGSGQRKMVKIDPQAPIARVNACDRDQRPLFRGRYKVRTKSLVGVEHNLQVLERERRDVGSGKST